ncbi:MAG: hypothetical protein ACPLRS_03475 [Hydrogenobacter sp.]
MKIQTVLHKPEEQAQKLEFFKNWEELTYTTKMIPYEDCYIAVVEIPDEDFEKLVGIFQSKEEAMGAFLSNAMEYEWEIVPESYVIYHAHFEDNKLFAGLLPKDSNPAIFDHLHLENMVKEMAKYPRVVVYSYDVVTYIKDVYPEVDNKLYVITREISKVKGYAPDLQQLAQIYGVILQSLEDKLRFIQELITKPIKLKDGELLLPPVDKPTITC